MAPRPPFARADFASGLALGALGAYIAAEAWRWPYMGPDGPGAGFFPLWYGLAMSALALALVVRSARGEAASPTGAPRGVARALGAWAALVVAVALLKVIGFVASFALLTWFIIAIMFRQPLLRAALIALAFAAAFHLLFDVALGVALPTPHWPF